VKSDLKGVLRDMFDQYQLIVKIRCRNSPSSAAIVGIGKPKIFEKISLIFDTNGPTSS
jgi:hypothetical protein